MCLLDSASVFVVSKRHDTGGSKLVIHNLTIRVKTFLYHIDLNILLPFVTVVEPRGEVFICLRVVVPDLYVVEDFEVVERTAC